VKEFMEKQLAQRTLSQSLRQLKPSLNLADFSSNDYLGFARSGELYKLIKDNETIYAKILFPGAGASRLISGNHALYDVVEKKIAGVHKAERALIFNSGYDANLGLFASLASRHDTVFYDEYVHASIRDGIRLSLAKSYSFKHNNLDDFKKKLSRARGRVIVAVESVYSMDGIERFKQTGQQNYWIEDLVEYCFEKGFYVIVDEAHSTGVFGERGEGIVAQKKLETKVFARVHTFGKALGVHGAAVLGSGLLADYLVNYARSFIYTTALPPHSLLSILSSYEYLEKNTDTIQKLRENIDFFKSGFYMEENTNDSPIHYKIVGENKKCLELSRKCQETGFDVRAILSPTVPRNTERLRICLHSFNTRKEISGLFSLLGNIPE